MSDVQIQDLAQVTPTDNDLVLLSQNGGTKNASVQALRAIVNDLLTGGTDKTLSAEQGKILYNYFTNISQKIGDTSQLTYADLVSGILDLVSKLQDKANNLDNSRTTVAKDITGAINELNLGKASQTDLAQLSNPSLLINDCFQVWQRTANASKTLTNTRQYVPDRWLVGCDTGTVLVEKTNGIKLTLQSVGNMIVSQKYTKEEIDLRGKRIAISCKTSSNIAALLNLYTAVNSTYTLVGSVNISAGTDIVSELVVTVPTDANIFDFEINTVSVASGSYLNVQWGKLEIGDKATHFVPRLYAEELALCQRYYFSMESFGNNWSHGSYVGGGGFRVLLPITEALRITPTYIVNILGAVQFYDDSNAWQTLTYSGIFVSNSFISISFSNPSSNATVGKSYLVRYLPSFDAEIY